MQVRELLHALRSAPEECRLARGAFGARRAPEQIRKLCRQPFAASFLEEARKDADALGKRPIPVLPYSVFSRFFSDGNRVEYEGHYFERRREMGACALLCWAGDDAYLGRLEDLLWAVCEESAWALPAHLADAVSPYRLSHEGQGRRSPADTLDLFCCETAFALAEILYLLEDRLGPMVRERIRAEIGRRVWKSLCAPLPNPVWEEIHNNWTAVCAGALGGATLYLIEDEAVLAPILSRLLCCMEDYISSFPEDGACVEGVGYWGYGMGYLAAFGELLRLRTGGKVDIFRNSQLETIAAFPQKCYFADGTSVSFADGSCHDHYHIGLSCFFAGEYPHVSVPPLCCAAGYHDNACYTWCFLFRDIFWLDQALAGSSGGLQRVDYLQDAQWITTQGGWDTGFAAKGGTNGDPHNHNDLGGFIYHRGGRPLLEDLEAGEYTAAYFGPNRYQILCNSSLGHSVPIIGGQEQGTGGDFAARDVEYGPGARMRMELKDAYPPGTVESFVREFSFDQQSGVLRLRDRFRFAHPGGTVTERFITAIKPELTQQGVRLGGTDGALLIAGDHTLPVIGTQPHHRHDGQTETVYTMDYVYPCAEKETVFCLTVIPWAEQDP